MGLLAVDLYSVPVDWPYSIAAACREMLAYRISTEREALSGQRNAGKLAKQRHLQMSRANVDTQFRDIAARPLLPD